MIKFSALAVLAVSILVANTASAQEPVCIKGKTTISTDAKGNTVIKTAKVCTITSK